ncbi:uncharacterized protein J4E92_001325 [Alternaria infectoria]|uniref:uncharacterized protein n=1 Tax=Alternaria infectoria TaxID=45303 RepID=UPI0022207EC1|nr:uncharacterized protein J4E92_001325 [Alternaria infectoria]KAI4940037.1 hypothetical protein J4E92_001325 [Alternaria infectoria]
MPALRSQGEFFMTGIVPAGPQPEESDCSICAEHLAEDVVRIARPCGHMFHAVCLLTWLQGDGRRNRTCPNCRCELYAAPAPAPSSYARTREGIMERRMQAERQAFRRAGRVEEGDLRLAQLALGRQTAATRTSVHTEPVNFDRRNNRSTNTPESIRGWARRTQAEMSRQMTPEDRELMRRLRQTAQEREQEREDEEARAALDRLPPGSERVLFQSVGTPNAPWRSSMEEALEDGALVRPRENRRNTMQRMSQMVADGEAPEIEELIRRQPAYHALGGEPAASSANQTRASGRAEARATLQSTHDLAVAEMRQLEAARLQDGLLHDSAEAVALERNLADLNRIRRDSIQQIQQFDRRAAEEDRSSDDSIPSIRERRRQRMAARRAAGEDSSSDDSSPSIRTRQRRRMAARRAAGEDSSSDDSSPSIRTRRRRRMSARQAAGEDSSSDASSDVPSIRMTRIEAMANLRAAEEARSPHNSNLSSRLASAAADLDLSRARTARIEQDIQTLLDGASRGHTSQTPESSATNNIPPQPTQSAARGLSNGRTIYPDPPRNTTEPIAPARDIAPSRLARARRVALLAGRGDDVPEEEIAEYYGFPGLTQLQDEATFTRMSNLARMRVRAQAAAEMATVDMMNEQDDEIRNLFWPGRQANDNN